MSFLCKISGYHASLLLDYFLTSSLSKFILRTRDTMQLIFASSLGALSCDLFSISYYFKY